MDGLIVEDHLMAHYEKFHMGRGYGASICSGVFRGTNRLCVSIMHVFPEEDLEPGIDYWADEGGYDADEEPTVDEPSRLYQLVFKWDISRRTRRYYEIIDEPY